MPPKVKFVFRGRDGLRTSDPGAHPRVAETPPPSAAPPSPDAPPPTASPPDDLTTRKGTKIKIRFRRRPQGSDLIAQLHRAETLASPASASDAPPLSATRTSLPASMASPPPRRNPPRRARGISTSNAQDFEKEQETSQEKTVSKGDSLGSTSINFKQAFEKEQETSQEKTVSRGDSLGFTSINFKSMTKCGKICLKEVALVSDEEMLLHEPPDPTSDENPERLIRIMSKLKETKLSDRCDMFKPDEAARSYLLAVHSKMHIKDIESIVTKNQKQRNEMASKIDDIYYSQGSTRAALLAAGGSMKACSLVAEGMYRNSFAIVRPPVHHAGKNGLFFRPVHWFLLIERCGYWRCSSIRQI